MIQQVCITQGTFWVKKKKSVCGDVIAFQVFALKVVSKMFA
jgi:hypothetical protein